eukprot:g3623.t1
MATLLGCDAIPAASACAKEARQHLPRECCGDAFEEELVSQPLPAAPAPAAEIRRSTRIARVETQEKYLDLASVPGYDPAYLMGWRLSTTGHHTVEDQPEGNTQLSTKNGWSSAAACTVDAEVYASIDAPEDGMVGIYCNRQFLAENCEISPSLLDALPFLRTLEDPSFHRFSHPTTVASKELSVSDATCEQSFRQLSRRGGSGGALQPKCQQRAQQLCIHRFEANIPWKEWEEVLSVAFRGAGPKLTYTSWAVACRRTMRIVGGGSKRLMTVESFVKALVDVAVQVMAPEPEDVLNSLEDFCKRVRDTVVLASCQDLLGVLELQEKPEVKRLLQDCSFGIQKLFLCYASEPTSKRAFWNSDSVTRFAIDFDFLGEVSNLPLQRMFQDRDPPMGYI